MLGKLMTFSDGERPSSSFTGLILVAMFEIRLQSASLKTHAHHVVAQSVDGLRYWATPALHDGL